MWLSLPTNVDTGPHSALYARAREAGVSYVPGEYCYPSGGERPKNGMRLSFGVQSEERIHLGIQKLSAAIREVL